ncbi:MAG: alpha-L-fucosidase [Deltaproteobacteria bacterium]|nr:alpha-L-fucosidase [Deltaproteobacteria bacterium]
MVTNDSPNQVYEPTLESVKQHQAPQWFLDAKFGIFIHWSLSSIPAFAPAGSRDIVETIRTRGWKAQYKNNSYAEWYLNSLKIKGIKPQGKPWTRFKRNDPAASGRGIKTHNKLLPVRCVN